MARPINQPRTNTFKEEPREEIIMEEALPPVDKKVRKVPEKKARTAKPTKEKKLSTEQELARSERRFRVLGLFFLLTSLFLLFSFTSYILSWQADFSFTDTIFKHFTFDAFFENKIPVENWMGKIGALTGYLFISKWLRGYFDFFFCFLHIDFLFNFGLVHNNTLIR